MWLHKHDCIGAIACVITVVNVTMIVWEWLHKGNWQVGLCRCEYWRDDTITIMQVWGVMIGWWEWSIVVNSSNCVMRMEWCKSDNMNAIMEVWLHQCNCIHDCNGECNCGCVRVHKQGYVSIEVRWWWWVVTMRWWLCKGDYEWWWHNGDIEQW